MQLPHVRIGKMQYMNILIYQTGAVLMVVEIPASAQSLPVGHSPLMCFTWIVLNPRGGNGLEQRL